MFGDRSRRNSTAAAAAQEQEQEQQQQQIPPPISPPPPPRRRSVQSPQSATAITTPASPVFSRSAKGGEVLLPQYRTTRHRQHEKAHSYHNNNNNGRWWHRWAWGWKDPLARVEEARRHRHLGGLVAVFAFLLFPLLVFFLYPASTTIRLQSLLPLSPFSSGTDEMTIGGGYMEKRPTRDATLHPQQIASLPAEYLPGYRPGSSSLSGSAASTAGRRLIVIGDVHGELEVLQRLLRKVGYVPRAQGGRDHVVLAGDIVNKGPDSSGVLGFAMQEGFSGVRGNHDDKLLKLFEKHMGEVAEDEDEAEEVSSDMSAISGESDDDAEDGEGNDDENNEYDEPEEAEGEEANDEDALNSAAQGLELLDQQNTTGDFNESRLRKGKHGAHGTKKKKNGKKHKNKKKNKKKHMSKKDREGLAVIRSCTPEQRRWLANLPLILRVGRVPHMSPSSSASASTLIQSPYGGEIVVVHGGLIPGIPLAEQDPWAILHMRTILLKKQRSASITEDEEQHSNEAIAANDDDDDDDGEEDEDELLRLPLATDDDDTTTVAAVTRKKNKNKKNKNKGALKMTPLETREGKPWARIWDKFQRIRVDDPEERITVVFGHDAKAGLQPREYSFGLDTGCVAGGHLSAMVFYEEEQQQQEKIVDYDEEGVATIGHVRVAHEIVSVKCKA